MKTGLTSTALTRQFRLREGFVVGIDSAQGVRQGAGGDVESHEDAELVVHALPPHRHPRGSRSLPAAPTSRSP
jgi:hypothetical protein